MYMRTTKVITSRYKSRPFEKFARTPRICKSRRKSLAAVSFPRLFLALEPNYLSDTLWSPPSGFDMVNLSRIFEKHEGFYASPRRERSSRIVNVSSSVSPLLMQPTVHEGDLKKGKNLHGHV